MTTLLNALLGSGIFGFVAHLINSWIQGNQDSKKAQQEYQSKQLDMQLEEKRNTHELAMLQLSSQIQLQQKSLETSTTEILNEEFIASNASVTAASKEQETPSLASSKYMINLNASIRPIITYAFSIIFLGILISYVRIGYKTEGFTFDMFKTLLGVDFVCNMLYLYVNIVSFWFGDRTSSKIKSKS